MIHEEHDEFMAALLNALKSDEANELRTSKSHIVARCGVRPPRVQDPDKGKQKKQQRYQPQKQSCKWRLSASWMHTERSFQVKKLDDEHTCARNFKYGTLINYKWIGRHFADRIRQQPDIKFSILQELALNEYERSLEEHHALLKPYVDALLRTNPGSTVQLGTTTNPDGETYFDRFYVCLNGLKQRFKKGCRRVVALDGCFLKGSCQGELLTAMGRDGNNQIFPIAWAIVNVENWTWFLTLLSNDLEAPNGQFLTLMSDQHKGLVEAAKNVMPRAEHRQCARHIYENFRKTYSGVEYRHLFWRAAKASYPAQFDAVIKEMNNVNPKAFKYLMERNPKSWSRALFETENCCESVENGYSECWNSVLVKVRNKPIITLLESLRVILMIRLESMREKSSRWEHEVCPAIRKKLDIIKSLRSDWMTIHAGGNKFEVRNHRYAYSVDMDMGTCDCRMWQLSGIPCVHTMQAIYKKNKDPEDFVAI
uniref:uncharacterized protein LOC122587908 n=1 Tax=Erigeron canadensis TaxID=72917 RepID=UPI001CB8F18B|nr:uncharacterized protein LOC122587908 [Erigeron canadensis]